jgi:demethylmenaquinone methyltransferase/2-methoxy-6-polyprenyl-1,4-benzoquinol methylase
VPSREAARIRETQSIFAGIADGYDVPAQVFGLGRYRAWHRALVDMVAAGRPARVLDMCTGTGAIAAAIAARTDAHVVAADITRPMLARARRRPQLRSHAAFVQAAAQAPPFAPASFDAVVFSYLLRYVEDVPGTIAALARLVRPGGLLASLEFGVPDNGVARAAWLAYTRAVLPLGLGVLSPGWRRVGGFLGDSITRLYRRHPIAALESYFRAAGLEVQPTRRLSLGGGVIMSGVRPCSP